MYLHFSPFSGEQAWYELTLRWELECTSKQSNQLHMVIKVRLHWKKDKKNKSLISSKEL